EPNCSPPMKFGVTFTSAASIPAYRRAPAGRWAVFRTQDLAKQGQSASQRMRQKNARCRQRRPRSGRGEKSLNRSSASTSPAESGRNQLLKNEIFEQLRLGI